MAKKITLTVTLTAEEPEKHVESLKGWLAQTFTPDTYTVEEVSGDNGAGETSNDEAKTADKAA